MEILDVNMVSSSKTAFPCVLSCQELCGNMLCGLQKEKSFFLNEYRFLNMDILAY